MENPLKTYLITHNMSMTQFADKISDFRGARVWLPTISSWVNGRRRPNCNTMMVIEVVTEGQVTPTLWKLYFDERGGINVP